MAHKILNLHNFAPPTILCYLCGWFQFYTITNNLVFLIDALEGELE